MELKTEFSKQFSCYASVVKCSSFLILNGWCLTPYNLSSVVYTNQQYFTNTAFINQELVFLTWLCWYPTEHILKSLVKCFYKSGSCVPDQTGEYFCQISAWCPVENDEKLSRSTPVLNNTEKFTVYIKNSVAFPYFGMEYRKNNIEGDLKG